MARFILKVSITLRRRVRNSPKAADIMRPSPTFRRFLDNRVSMVTWVGGATSMVSLLNPPMLSMKK